MQAVSNSNPSVNRLYMALTLFGAPAAWVAQMSLSEIVTSYACYPHAMPIVIPLIDHIALWLAVIHSTAFIMGMISAGCAFAIWRKTSALKASESSTRFLALLGILSSSLFLIAIIFTASAFLMVSPCGS